jgi:hypothetical protein
LAIATTESTLQTFRKYFAEFWVSTPLQTTTGDSSIKIKRPSNFGQSISTSLASYMQQAKRVTITERDIERMPPKLVIQNSKRQFLCNRVAIGECHPASN